MGANAVEARETYERGIDEWSAGRQQEALHCFEQALRLDPAIADLPYREGVARAHAGNVRDAEGWLWLAHLFRPEHAPTLSCLGDVLRRLGRIEEALPLLEEAVTLSPESWEAHSDLGLAFCDLDRLDEARNEIECAIRLHGIDARLIVNLATVRKFEGWIDDALRLTGEAIRLQPELAAAHVNRAHLLLLTGRYAEGWEEYEWRPQKSLPAGRKLPGNGWSGRTVLLHQEQGAGDLIQFIRYASLLEGAQVTVSCDERFIPLIRGVHGVAHAVSWNAPSPSLDLEANVMSLPHILNADFQKIQVPYLRVDPERVEAWRRRLGGESRRRIGLVWGGNPANPVERRRRVGLARLLPLLDIPNLAFYSLQQGPQRAELGGIQNIIDLAPETVSPVETAAAMMNLDLIITVDSMPAHLAGALGRPVWVLLHFMADWRWLLDREDSPWYPQTRLFRQQRPGEWEPVIERLAQALQGMR
jgi:Flp pilus assembly protein TadD